MFNHLRYEKSPYLQQHATNPVDWYPWDREAFLKAETENKPIFLSIGYATCHWCHVMAEESFQDKEIAKILNTFFVPVKVDREERPDVDALYCDAARAMHRQVGWPLNLILTPDLKPFYAATYMPKRSIYEMMGLYELLMQVSVLWDDKREILLNSADQVASFLNQDPMGYDEKARVRSDLIHFGAAQLLEGGDSLYGGTGRAPKFPMPHNLNFLLSYSELEAEYDRDGVDSGAVSLFYVENTLENMFRGGIYDHVGGGFFRYSTDQAWLMPHFEKTLYDNALLAGTFTEVYKRTGNEGYKNTAKNILDFMIRDMSGREGGFISGTDADSEGKEGLFYLFEPYEIMKVLGEEDGEAFCKEFHINFDLSADGICVPNRIRFELAGEHHCCHGHDGEEGEHHCCHEGEEGEHECHCHDGEEGQGHCCHEGEEGEHHCHCHDSKERDFVKSWAMFEDIIPDSHMEGLVKKLYEYRKHRHYLAKDSKILTAWNAMAVSALTKAGFAFMDTGYLKKAAATMHFIEKNLMDPDGTLYARFIQGEKKHRACLSDYAYLALAYLDLYETAFDAACLEKAIGLAKRMCELFLDKDKGGFFLSDEEENTLIARTKDLYDGALPSGNGTASMVLARLASLTKDPFFTEMRDRQFKFMAGPIRQYPSGYTMTLMAMQRLFYPTKELLVVSSGSSPDFALLQKLAKTYDPNLSLIFLNPENAEKIRELLPWTKAYPIPAEGCQYYLCENGACKLPVEEVSKLMI